MTVNNLITSTEAKKQLDEKPLLKDLVLGILGRERLSAMKPDSAQKFLNRRTELQGRSEQTMQRGLMPFLFRDVYTIRLASDRNMEEEFENGRRMALIQISTATS